MQKIIVMDYLLNNEESSFVLNLEDMEETFSNFHLSLDLALKEGYNCIDRLDFYKAKVYSKLCIRISEYGNGAVNALIDMINGKEIIHIYEKDNKDISDIYLLILSLDNFLKVLSSHYNLDVTEELTNTIDRVYEIKEDIAKNLDKITYKISFDNLNLSDVEKLEELSKYNDNLAGIYNKALIHIEDKVTNLKTLKYRKLKKELEILLKDKCNEGYFISKEFQCLIKEKIENYKDLLDKTNKSYLLYRFNLENDVDEKIKILYEFDIDECFEIPYIYREYIVESIIEDNKIYVSNEELIDEVKSLIAKIKDFKNIAIPV
ncbi:hypothetical protein [Clostridium algidicarnis]|uniref:hypothetical protein n=1 Tax=Clostridium algidicarnis TaxID=37659 RepID=UPI0004964B7C|nr:hypothetical protein [Clostridium algidicarnis]